MPTTQKSPQKHTKATQKVGGSAKKPAVTKAMEGGSAKKPVTKVTGGGSTKKPVVTKAVGGGSTKKPAVTKAVGGGNPQIINNRKGMSSLNALTQRINEGFVNGTKNIQSKLNSINIDNDIRVLTNNYSSTIKYDIKTFNIFKHLININDVISLVQYKSHFLDTQWIEKSTKYVKDLKEDDKKLLTLYTKEMAYVINSFLRNNGVLVVSGDEIDIKKEPYINHFEYILRYYYDENKVNMQKQYNDIYNAIQSKNEDLKTIIHKNNENNPFINELMTFYVNKLKKIICESPALENDMIVYRGETIDRKSPLHLGNFYKDTNSFKDKGFLSVTSSIDVAKMFINRDKGCCLQIIKILKGSKILPLRDVSFFDFQDEFLIEKEKQFKIVKTYNASTKECLRDDCYDIKTLYITQKSKNNKILW